MTHLRTANTFTLLLGALPILIPIYEFMPEIGRLTDGFGSARILLLTMVGRRSGKARTTPVSFVDLDGRTAISAANLGSGSPLAWFRNLLDAPNVEVTIGEHTHAARGRVGTRR